MTPRCGNLLHTIAHALHWQYGETVSNWSGDTLWVAFRCRTCGSITGAHSTSTKRHCVPGMAAYPITPPLTWRR